MKKHVLVWLDLFLVKNAVINIKNDP